MIIMHREQVEKVRSGELTSVLIECAHPYNWKVGAIHAVKTCMSGRALAYVRVVDDPGKGDAQSRLKPAERPAEASGTTEASGTVLVRERVYFELVTVFDYLKQERPGWNGRHG